MERRAIKLLKEKLDCFEAQRSAGSHSLIDVWGIDRNGRIYLIQLKRQKTMRSIGKTLEKYSPPPDVELPDNVFWMLWVWIDRKGWDFYLYCGKKNCWDKMSSFSFDVTYGKTLTLGEGD